MPVTKYCFVPGCYNSSITKPEKIFVSVPCINIKRQKWFEAVGRTDCCLKTNFFCCEDHFDLPNDTENWLFFKTMGTKNTRLIFKENAVPSLIKNIKIGIEPSQLTDSAKKRREEVIKKIEKCTPKKIKFEDPILEDSLEDRPVDLEDSLEDGLKNPLEDPVPSTSFAKPTANPIKRYSSPSKSVAVSFSSSSTDFSTFISEYSDYEEQSESTSGDNELLLKDHFNELNRKCTFYNIEKNSRLYLGLPNEEYFILKFVTEHINIKYRDLLITLKKIRCNDSYNRLGINFALSNSSISNIFTESIIKIATFFKQLIYWPDKWEIKKALPTTFRYRYNKVQSIIDCLEIEIETPSNALHQALTWSNYKKCNTIKYLLSSTPNGIVNFISPGYGGRTSDHEIVNESGFLNSLPEDCEVMADRGFKQIEHLLFRKKCKLVRPPSASVDKKFSKEESLETKRIAALRIHVERVIRRLREFEMLAPHACININLIKWLDYIIIICCGIINLQGPLIK